MPSDDVSSARRTVVIDRSAITGSYAAAAGTMYVAINSPNAITLRDSVIADTIADQVAMSIFLQYGSSTGAQAGSSAGALAAVLPGTLSTPVTRLAGDLPGTLWAFMTTLNDINGPQNLTAQVLQSISRSIQLGLE